jgi:hypothetical protein
MNWASFTRKQKQMVIGTIVLSVAQVILMAHFLGWTKPAAARGGEAKKELIELETKLDDAHTILKRDESIRKELSQGVERLDALAAYLPALSDRYAWAYEYVSRCATQSKVSLDSLEEVPVAEAGKNNSVYEIKASTRCGYNNLVEILWRLEKDNPLLRISQVAIASVDNMPESHRVSIFIQWPSSLKIEKGAQ